MKLARRLAGFQGAWCTFGVLGACAVALVVDRVTAKVFSGSLYLIAV